MKFQEVSFSEFLKHRDDRFDPCDKRIAGLKRIEKINFSGSIVLSDKPSNTDMIVVKKGDLVISGINVAKGALAIYDDKDDVAATIHYSSYEFDKNKINIDYLKWFLKSPAFVNLIKEQLPGGIKTEIKPKHLLPLRVRLPLIADQIQLAKQFENTEKEFAQLEKEIETQQTLLKKLRQQILQDAVQGKLIPQNKSDEPATELLKKIKSEKGKIIAEGKLRKGKLPRPIKEEEIPFELPRDWTWCRLEDVVAQIFDGPFGSHLKTVDYTSSGVQVIRLENLGEQKFKEEKETFISITKYETIKQHTVYEGDVLIGSFLADGVKCVVLPLLNYPAIAKADCFTIRIKHQMLSNKFVMYLLSSDLMFTELSKLLRGMTRLRINTTQLKHLLIPLPPLAEQHRIVSKVEQSLQLCKELEKNIEQNQRHAKQLRRAVLLEVFKSKTTYENPASVYPIAAEAKESSKTHRGAAPFFKRTVLATHIAHQLHNEWTFGHKKFQKILYLCEHITEIDLNDQTKKLAAGPLDSKFMYSVDAEMKKHNWYRCEKHDKGYKYYPMENPEGYKTYFPRYFTEREETINRIIELFRKEKSDFCELIATIYAVWNNLLIEKKSATAIEIEKGFFRWSEEKKLRFQRKDVEDGIEWIRDKGIAPKGFGNFIK